MAAEWFRVKLTREQKDQLQYFINFNDWNANVEAERAEEVAEAVEEEDHDASFPLPQHIDGEEECPDCFCAPCTVHEKNRQLWWPDRNSQPKSVNAKHRKGLYQRFWSVMQNCGAWKDNRYLRKKVEAGGKRCFAWHRREIMPECVLRQCREWLPNPEKVKYMGHKWQ